MAPLDFLPCFSPHHQRGEARVKLGKWGVPAINPFLAGLRKWSRKLPAIPACGFPAWEITLLFPPSCGPGFAATHAPTCNLELLMPGCTGVRDLASTRMSPGLVWSVVCSFTPSVLPHSVQALFVAQLFLQLLPLTVTLANTFAMLSVIILLVGLY